MTIDKLGLYNSALRLMGERKLASLAEVQESRRVLDGIWDEDVIKTCLEQGQWAWASRTIRMEPSNTVAPDFGFRYAFEKPDDWVRTVMISADEYFSEALNRFKDEAGYIWCDLDILYLSHVSDDVNYGRDFSLWTPSFQRYVTAYMAYEGSLRLTASHSIQDRLEQQMAKRLSDAQSKDAVTRPVQFPSRGSWVGARVGRDGRTSDRRR